MGNTVWGSYGKVWFTTSVYPGKPEAPETSMTYKMYADGAHAFSGAGKMGSVFNLALSFAFMGLGFTSLPTHLIYAPCLFIASFVCFLCAFVVGHSHTMAVFAFVLSNVGLTAAGSVPYGIVAVWNKQAEEAGKVGSVAMQMAILNCCITVGQQLCTTVLSGLEGSHTVPEAIKILFVISFVANSAAGIGSCFLQVGGSAATTVESD